MTTATSSQRSLGDRYSDWAVIVVTLVAVLLGWLLMSSVQSRSVAFDSGGVKGLMPAAWLTDQADKGVVLHTTELGGSGFGTTYQVEVVPVASDATAPACASLYSIDRAQNLSTVRVLDQQDVTVNGQTRLQGHLCLCRCRFRRDARRYSCGRARRGLLLRGR